MIIERQFSRVEAGSRPAVQEYLDVHVQVQLVVILSLNWSLRKLQTLVKRP